MKCANWNHREYSLNFIKSFSVFIVAVDSVSRQQRHWSDYGWADWSVSSPSTLPRRHLLIFLAHSFFVIGISIQNPRWYTFSTKICAFLAHLSQKLKEICCDLWSSLTVHPSFHPSIHNLHEWHLLLTTVPVLTKFHWNDPWVILAENCRFGIHAGFWLLCHQNFKNFSETTGQISV